MFENILLRKALTGSVFFMAFLLTPRAWVEPDASRSSTETIPVRMLERPGQRDNCLWCAPIEPVDCEVEDSTKDPASTSERIWLNPDEPPPESETTPCIERREDDSTPSA